MHTVYLIWAKFIKGHLTKQLHCNGKIKHKMQKKKNWKHANRIVARQTNLAIDSIDLSVLVLQLRSHINGHVSQIANHCVHLSHVVLHFFFTRIICYPKTHIQTQISRLITLCMLALHYTIWLCKILKHRGAICALWHYIGSAERAVVMENEKD